MADPVNAESKAEVSMLNSMFSEHQLKEKIEVLELENQTMKKKLQSLQDQYSMEQRKQTDLVWFYRQENEKKDEIIDKLTEESAKHISAKRVLKDQFDEKLKALEDRQLKVKQELQDNLDALALDNKSLRGFCEHKREMEAKIELLKKTIESDRTEHTRNINDLERRNVSEKERLKKEMLRKIKETKLTLLAMTEDQLHTTTKRTIMENEQMTIELQYQSKEAERLVSKNNALQQANAAIRRDLELQKDTEKLLATRTHFLQKLIKKLNQRLKRHESTIRELESNQASVEKAVKGDMFTSNDVIRNLETKLRQVSEQRDEAMADAEVVRAELDTHRRELEYFLELQDESITFIWSSIESLREKKQNAPGASKTPSGLTEAQRQQLLETLCCRLQHLRGAWGDVPNSSFAKLGERTSKKLSEELESAADKLSVNSLMTSTQQQEMQSIKELELADGNLDSLANEIEEKIHHQNDTNKLAANNNNNSDNPNDRKTSFRLPEDEAKLEEMI